MFIQSKYWYEYMELEKKANEIYNTLKNTNWDTLTEQAKMYTQEKLQWERNRVIMWDPNRIEFQVINVTINVILKRCDQLISHA